MPGPVHRGEQTGDAGLDRIQNGIRNLIAALKMIPFLFGGRLVSVVLAANVPKAVIHGLGVPAAFLIVRQSYVGSGVAPRIQELASTFVSPTADPRKVGVVNADTDCTVDLWFYPAASAKVPQ